LNAFERKQKSGKPLPLSWVVPYLDTNLLINEAKPWALQWRRNRLPFAPANDFLQLLLDLAAD
jgi:hypothetical protein